MLETLARQIRDRKVVLFAGAGLSVPLGLPSWRGLMEHMASDLDYEPDVLIRPDADYMRLAEFYKLERGSIGPLRSWMDRNWAVDDDKIKASRVHNLIVDLDFPFIYTTNYDNGLERTFELRDKPFSKVTSMLDVADARAELPHIVKFHGDFSSDDSLVLTESDYFERLSFEGPLDIKFRADVLGRGILFVGYSLDDLNLRILMYRLQRLWESSGHADRRPESFIFMLRPDPVQERVFRSRGITPIVYDGDDPKNALPNLFGDLLTAVQTKV